MRKLFLLIALAFTAYYGSSLWLFTDADSWKVVNNYLPVALLIGMFIIGLIHIRFALGLAILLILLLGNPNLLNGILINIFHLPESCAVFNSLYNPMESIILGLFSAWIIIRFFGNPELDYEYNRANAVRSLHFPVFIFGFTAVLAAVYSIILMNNLFYADFWTSAQNALIKYPFAFLNSADGSTILQPLRSVIFLLEGIAVYIIVTNEIRSARQVRAFMWLLLAGAVIVSILAVVQLFGGAGFTIMPRNTFADGIAFYNREVNSTFSTPNNLAVFLVAMLPICAAMIVRGKTAGIIGLITGALLIAAVILSATKLAILLTVVFLIAVVIVVITRAIKRGSIWPLVLTAVLVVAVLGIYLTAKIKAKDKDAKWATGIVKKVDGTATAFIKGKWDLKSLNKRTNFKSGDWLTAVNVITPAPDGNVDNLLVGVGYDQLDDNYQKYKSPAASSRRTGASNMFLQIFAETGLFGALALVLVTIFAILYSFRSASQLEYPVYVKAVAWALTLLAIGCMTENAFLTYQIQVVFWILVGLCMVFVSLSAKNGISKGSAFIKFIIFILVIASWGWIVYPKLVKQKEQAKIISDLAAKYGERYTIVPSKLEKALKSTKDFNFHRKGRNRWSDNNSLVMTMAEQPVMAVMLQCVHPDVATNNPVNAAISIDGESLTNIVFLSQGNQLIEIDISQNPKLSPYLSEKQDFLVKFVVDRTWNPSVVYPQFPNDNFEVGVGVSPIAWKKTTTPKPPKPPVAPAVKKETPEAKPEQPAAATNVQQKVETPAE